jgi:hypothetical protein
LDALLFKPFTDKSSLFSAFRVEVSLRLTVFMRIIGWIANAWRQGVAHQQYVIIGLKLLG